MKYEIAVCAYNYYRKQYFDCPDSDNFEAQFFFWKRITNFLTNESTYISNKELLRLITLEARKMQC
jgi:hypothetical protein